MTTPIAALRRFAARALAHLTTALVSALALALLATVAPAQSANTATITGRVQNQAANLSLENARVTVAGTTREAFTDAFGEYRLAGLTPGNVTLTVFSTGLIPQTTTLAVPAGTTAQRDFALVPTGLAPAATAADGTVKLDSFVVGAARETNAATIAINNGIEGIRVQDGLGHSRLETTKNIYASKVKQPALLFAREMGALFVDENEEFGMSLVFKDQIIDRE